MSDVRALLVIGLLLVCGAAHSETDVLLRTVGFALTGNDDAANVYYLNNVYYDRIRFKGWQRQGLEKSITVELHGDDVVFEETTRPVGGQGLDPDTLQRLQAARPDFFQSHHYTYKQLRLDTGDMDRVKGAWQYIYSHGCTGKQSPS